MNPFGRVASEKVAARCSELLLALLSLSQVCAMASAPTTCFEVKFGDDKLACQCNATHCDSGLHFDWPVMANEFTRLSSNKAGARFVRTRLFQSKRERRDSRDGDRGKTTRSEGKLIIRVTINEHYQRVLGYGGALTDSSASLMMQLSDPIRARLLDDYFGAEGLDYNLMRIPIGGTDMSSRAYTYNDLHAGQTDFSLANFALQPEDLKLKIPLIKRINKNRAERKLGALKLMAACWSPPAWMKDNQNLVQGNLLAEPGVDVEKNRYYAAYATYIVRFLEAYAQNNITLWALSAQNEPRSPARLGLGPIHHNSINFTPEQLVDFYKFHLLPQLHTANFSADKLNQFIWDDVFEDMDSYVKALLAEPRVRNSITGVAYHWYSQGLRQVPFAGIERAFHELPFRYSMISTEASYPGGQRPGDWSHGSGYALDLIRTLRTGFIGWIDWNLALDKSGGPTWARNPLDSAVQIEPETQSYIKNPMFYALAHVARFIPANSTIVDSDLEWSRPDSSQTKHIHALAAEMTQNTILTASGQLARRVSIVLLNMSNSTVAARLELPDCKLKRDFADLQIDLQPNSLDSLAFIC